MIDHLLRFNTYAAARAAFGLGESDPIPPNVCLNIGGPNNQSVRIVTQEAVWDNTDPENPVLVTPEQILSGWWCIVALEQYRANLPGLKAAFARDVSKDNLDARRAWRREQKRRQALIDEAIANGEPEPTFPPLLEPVDGTYILLLDASIPPATLATYKMEPQLLGSEYWFKTVTDDVLGV